MQIKSATFGQLQNNCYLVTDEASGRSALVDCTEYSDKMKDFIGDAFVPTVRRKGCTMCQ